MIRIRTVSRQLVDLESPQASTIRLDDIVRGLSNCCRFAGQVYDFYSVAQHSVLVAMLVDQRFQKRAMLHDATEAYMGDLSRHLKHHPLLAGYRQLEAQLNALIMDHFNVPAIPVDCVSHIKAADDLAAIFEHITLRETQRWNADRHITWALDAGFIVGTETHVGLMRGLARRLPTNFNPLPPRAAESLFWGYWHEVTMRMYAR